jgi:hypothetical protein
MLGRGDRRAVYRIYTEDEFLGDESSLDDWPGDEWPERVATDSDAVGESDARSPRVWEGDERGLTWDLPGAPGVVGGRRSIGSRSAGLAALVAAVGMVVGVVLLSGLRSPAGGGGRKGLGRVAKLGATAGVLPPRSVARPVRGLPRTPSGVSSEGGRSRVRHTRRGEAQSRAALRMAPAVSSSTTSSPTEGSSTTSSPAQPADSPSHLAGSPTLIADTGRPATESAGPQGALATPGAPGAPGGRGDGRARPEFGFER